MAKIKLKLEEFGNAYVGKIVAKIRIIIETGVSLPTDSSVGWEKSPYLFVFLLTEINLVYI